MTARTPSLERMKAMKRTGKKVRRPAIVAAALLTALVAAACTTGGGSSFRTGKDAQGYVRDHPATERRITAAMRQEEIPSSMNSDEARARAEQSTMRSVFDTSRGSEGWLLPSSHLLVNHFAAHNAPIVRIVFRNGRVVAGAASGVRPEKNQERP